MTEVNISDADLAPLREKVVLITGGSSGMGFAAVKILLDIGAKVVMGDLNPPKEDLSHKDLLFQKTDVTNYADLVSLFKVAKKTHGRIDHVFANAGIGPKVNYLDTDPDENGDLKEPSHLVYDVNQKGVINTTALAIYHMRPEQQSGGGSIVITASCSSFQPFRGIDYGTAKHAVWGYMRNMNVVLRKNDLPIRINAITPSWTDTGLVPIKLMNAAGINVQPASAAAKSALILMADESRTGHLMHSEDEKFKEIELSILIPAAKAINGNQGPSEDEAMKRVEAAVAAAVAGGKEVKFE